ncbi:MAG: hypothetical protein DA408_18005 [Bacteroidetes bacterium]|nr:MAG: hypothetical protein C7N36_13760 [Bacteroidota bacterium]PTM09593.1 MAG: hypothetical protein DA408_18005 [Bacteroidota bacterium]
MKTRRLSQGRIEVYNDRVRIRLQPRPACPTARVTFFLLKSNGYHYSKTVLEIQQPVTIQDIVKLYHALEEKVS